MKKSSILKATILTAFLLVCATVSKPVLQPSDIVQDDCGACAYKSSDCERLRSPGAKEAQNIVLLIGDGMGLNQVFAGRTLLNGPAKPLKWETLPHRGVMTTCSIRSITDSAASATAMATGHKTKKGAVCTGVSQGQEKLVNIHDLFGSHKSFGVVSNTKVWDATPAAFVARATSRDMDREIAREMVTKSRPRIILGGGANAFDPGKEDTSDGLDKLDITGLAKKGGYRVVRTASGLQALDPDSGHKVLGLFAPSALEYESERTDDNKEPHLSDMASFALDMLEEESKGFFLVIEGARIDHACHRMSMDKLLGEMKEFNETVNLVLKWREKHPHTLVIVTSDHETGGMKLTTKDYKKGDRLQVEWTTQDRHDHASHSSQRVPLYGIGPGSAAIKDHMDNTEIFCLIKNAFGNED